MFYFKDAGISPSKLDPEQLKKVQEFKSKIASQYGGLYHTFELAEEFQTKARIHLSTLVQDWLKTPPVPPRIETTSTAAPAIEAPGPLANLMALVDDDGSEGLIDLSERGNDAMAAVAAVVEKMSHGISELGDRFHQRTTEINELTRGDSKAAKRVANNAADDLEVYVKRMSVRILNFISSIH